MFTSNQASFVVKGLNVMDDVAMIRNLVCLSAGVHCLMGGGAGWDVQAHRGVRERLSGDSSERLEVSELVLCFHFHVR